MSLYERERERERERASADSVCVRLYLPCCSGEISLDMITLVITMPSEIPNPMTGAETQFVAKKIREPMSLNGQNEICIQVYKGKIEEPRKTSLTCQSVHFIMNFKNKNG